MERILIKHQTGSKANQTEAFSLADFISISFGRDSSVDVKYDRDRDDLVSRQHARITRESNNISQFVLTDLNSRNGTFVNESRIISPYHLNHGDRIQFGAGGPELVFELDPPPVNPYKQTRMASDLGAGQATREIPPETKERKISGAQPQQPGRMTMLERRIEEESYEMADRLKREQEAMQNKLNIEKQALNTQLDNEKSASKWRLIYVASGLLTLGIMGTGAFIYHNMKQENQLRAQQQQLEKAKIAAEQANEEIKQIKAVKSPQQIAAEFSKSVVFIRGNWELVDTKGRKIYLQYYKDRPAYEEQADGSIEPMLTRLENEGVPIAGGVDGSGFVISSNGYILTNRKTAEPWRSPCTCLLKLPGMLYGRDNKNRLVLKQILEEQDRSKLRWWKPQTSLKRYGIEMEGRHIKLNVTFPNTSLMFPARLVRLSDKADAALLRFDSPSPIAEPETDSNQDNVKKGDQVSVLGYPKASIDQTISIKSKEPVNFDREERVIPDPTITSGIIGKIIEDKPKIDGSHQSGDEIINLMGDSYQLSIDSGKGNSGGPVINNLGKVIGIYSFEDKSYDSSIAYAVPIKYGLELLSISPEQ